ncbi:MAG: DUF4922 domain-containing protein [Bacteroides sp.]|nr:DUF4922 domain-containing protein [Bacteroides sp.]
MVDRLIAEQTTTWEMARRNYEALREVRVRELRFPVEGGEMHFRLQYNPARIRSSAAKVDATSLQERPCFLCHRPSEQQALPFGGHYEILLNPFPIFPRHLTIVEREHLPQRIASRMRDMLALARLLPDYTVFYNGPLCGASAPDHAHFQAGNRGFMPVEAEWRHRVGSVCAREGKAVLLALNDVPRHALVLTSPSAEEAERLFARLYAALQCVEGVDGGVQVEPMLNILCYYEAGEWVLILFPRKRHRPSCYAVEEGRGILCSPASVDLGGVLVLPREEDFLKLTVEDVKGILEEVCLNWENEHLTDI